MDKIDIKNLKKLQNRVKALVKKNASLPPQRSIGWFKARNIAISASEVAACLTNTEEICRPYIEEFNIMLKIDGKCCSHFDNKEEYIIKKCRSYFGENVFKDSIYTLWGKKYEEIATRFYRILKNTDILEFGSLPHSKFDWIRASPDGITPDGVMLEIKCPFSRKINGTVPFHYWQQIMIQLFCSNLDVCDFLECELKEIDEESFYNYTLNNFPSSDVISGENPQKGIIINILDEPNNSETKYVYPPDNLVSYEDYIKWSNTKICELALQKKRACCLYWIIVKWNIIKVKARKDWIETIKPILKDTHKFIRNLQNKPELFEEYKESINLVKNKKYIEKYNETICLIDIDDINIDNSELNVSEEINYEMEDNLCLISDN
jgi:putative phage-type endonuclease